MIYEPPTKAGEKQVDCRQRTGGSLGWQQNKAAKVCTIHARQAILALHSMLLRSFSAAPWIAKTDGELKSSTVLANDTRNKQVVHNGLLLQAGLFSAGLDDAGCGSISCNRSDELAFF